ncbi:hypothetical protein DENIS_2282 [Desulfonema ishimotonii]|uniref:Uncharacterized protein n=1 Tax=Desulfonema ishimotonii TaxID=45657 RepID=A0A401FWF1_9BACT|nr:hypothetical protein DENIS_2282 [Desulfonema ishimotonii]
MFTRSASCENPRPGMVTGNGENSTFEKAGILAEKILERPELVVIPDFFRKLTVHIHEQAEMAPFPLSEPVV